LQSRIGSHWLGASENPQFLLSSSLFVRFTNLYRQPVYLLPQLTLKVILSAWTSRDVKITHECTAGAARNHSISFHQKIHGWRNWHTITISLWRSHLCFVIIYKWIREFRTGRISIFDKPVPAGHLSTISTLTNTYVMLLLLRSWNILAFYGNITKKTILPPYEQCQAT
jgi:hypothetical protein